MGLTNKARANTDPARPRLRGTCPLCNAPRLAGHVCIARARFGPEHYGRIQTGHIRPAAGTNPAVFQTARTVDGKRVYRTWRTDIDGRGNLIARVVWRDCLTNDQVDGDTVRDGGREASGKLWSTVATDYIRRGRGFGPVTVIEGRSNLDDCREFDRTEVKGRAFDLSPALPAPKPDRRVLGKDNILRPPAKPLPEKRSGYRAARADSD